MFGSFGLSPICANGLNPAIAPNPRCPFSCVSGSLGFWPVCMAGMGGGADAWDAPAERDTPFTMWMVCADWILYTDSTSSSWGGTIRVTFTASSDAKMQTDFQHTTCVREDLSTLDV